ncbi:uncharacterized protein LOC128278680 [Anopheles cruzii]|uniref:uncharacterized protein LOC128278680 n=1 Tax=Anopheles cruzii TaxID=68878 RepID=UPI0022EC61F9|nr:uncharacterized protein LOC128278680 [Anopheles cruzii]
MKNSLVLLGICLCYTLHTSFGVNYYFNNTPSKNTLRLTKFVCVDAPYQRTVLHCCKTIPRRNQSATLNVSLTVPEVINIVYFVAQLDYKYTTWQPLLLNFRTEGCAFITKKYRDPLSQYIYWTMMQNETYNLQFTMDSNILPRSIPTGEYRLKVKFLFFDNVTLFSVHVFFNVRSKGLFRSMIEW